MNIPDDIKRKILDGTALDSDSPFHKVGDEVRLREDAIEIRQEAAGYFRISHMWRGKEVMWQIVTNFTVGSVLTIPLNEVVELV